MAERHQTRETPGDTRYAPAALALTAALAAIGLTLAHAAGGVRSVPGTAPIEEGQDAT